MSQLLVLAKPRSDAQEADKGYVFRLAESETLVTAARLLLGLSDGDPVFTVTSPSGDPFEEWFDALPFDAERTNQLIDACARNFAALAFIYGDTRDLDSTNDLRELKNIIGRQFNSVPVELCAVWTEFPTFPASPESDEIVVQEGSIFERGRRLMNERLKHSADDTGMPFAIQSLQVSHSAQYPLIVRAHVQWTVEGQNVRSLEMVRIDRGGSQHFYGEVFG